MKFSKIFQNKKNTETNRKILTSPPCETENKAPQWKKKDAQNVGFWCAEIYDAFSERSGLLKEDLAVKISMFNKEWESLKVDPAFIEAASQEIADKSKVFKGEVIAGTMSFSTDMVEKLVAGWVEGLEKFQSSPNRQCVIFKRNTEDKTAKNSVILNAEYTDTVRQKFEVEKELVSIVITPKPSATRQDIQQQLKAPPHTVAHPSKNSTSPVIS